MTWEKVVLYGFLLLAAYGALHHILLRMEARGWIYYKTRPRGSGLGNALQELNAFANPAVKVVIERKFEQQEQDKSEDDPRDFV